MHASLLWFPPSTSHPQDPSIHCHPTAARFPFILHSSLRPHKGRSARTRRCVMSRLHLRILHFNQEEGDTVTAAAGSGSGIWDSHALRLWDCVTPKCVNLMLVSARQCSSVLVSARQCSSLLVSVLPSSKGSVRLTARRCGMDELWVFMGFYGFLF